MRPPLLFQRLFYKNQGLIKERKNRNSGMTARIRSRKNWRENMGKQLQRASGAAWQPPHGRLIGDSFRGGNTWCYADGC